MATPLFLNIHSSILLTIILLAVTTLLPSQGAKLRRQTNRIDCTWSKSSCEFYSHCIESQFPCGHDGFILSYAKKRCELIGRLEASSSSPKCSSTGGCGVSYSGFLWAHETDQCLKSALEEQLNRYNRQGLRSDPAVCLRWEKEAIDKMHACNSDAWAKYRPVDDAEILAKLFRIDDYYNSTVDDGIVSLLRPDNESLATRLSSNQTFDRRLYCVKGSAGSPSRDLTREESIFVVQYALKEQDLPETLYYYGGKDSLYDGVPCERNQPRSINTNMHGFHLISLFVPHGTAVNEKSLISKLIPQGFIAASMYELSASPEDSALAVVNYTRCGDGIRHVTEECDYGNSVEGCSLACKIQMDYDCNVDRHQPSMCSPEVCGDGLRTRGEECDDGNTANGDGCDSSCRQRNTRSCTTIYNETSSCQASAEQSRHIQFAPKQTSSYITARRLPPPHVPSKALAASRESIKRTIQLPADAFSSSSTVSSSLMACLTMTALTAITHLWWR